MTQRHQKNKLYIDNPTDPNYTAFNNIKHPFYTKAYKAYGNAKLRCNPSMKDKNEYQYNQYYGRGIRFKLNSFQEFIEEVGFPPSKDSCLDRIDNEGHYEKGNLRWVSRTLNNNNTRVNRTILIDGKEVSLMWCSRAYNIPYPTIKARLSRGWPSHLLFMPKRHQKIHYKLIKKLNDEFGYDDLVS